jgi:CRISPR-associated endonuclease/helicase Cas3
VYWVAISEGGYHLQLGWSPDAHWSPDLWRRDPDADREPVTTEEPGYDSDLLSVYGWRSIAEHTGDVIEKLDAILDRLEFDELPRGALTLAARWHDWGKAHGTFQAAIRDEAIGYGKRPGDRAGKRDIAKATPNEFWQRYKRPHFRHELASALGVLALLKSGQAPRSWVDLAPRLQNLALYLIAAHHGKVRLSIRSMPDEKAPDKADALFARGVWEGDPLPEVDLGGGVIGPAVEKLDLSPMMLGRVDGQPSWIERMLGLREQKECGPLKLAYLEAVLRAADIAASKAADAKARAKGEQP